MTICGNNKVKRPELMSVNTIIFLDPNCFKTMCDGKCAINMPKPGAPNNKL